MIDGFKILDTFEYRGIQGFVHADLSLSTIVRLEEFGDLDYLKDLEVEQYFMKKESVVNAMTPFGKGVVLPPVRAVGGTLYQYLSIPNERFNEEMDVIKNSNNSNTLYKGLLDQIVVEEMEKIAMNYERLKKYENYVTIRTYLSTEEEKKFEFKVKNKKYKKSSFADLYTTLLNNDYEAEQIKKKLFGKLNNLFERHKSAVIKFGAQSYSEKKIIIDGIQQDKNQNEILDLLGQVNVIRSFFSLPAKNSLSINNQPIFQMLDREIEFSNKYTKIDTNSEKYNIYDAKDNLIYSIYQDENGSVIIEDKKIFENHVVYNSYLIDNLKKEIPNLDKALIIVKEDNKENYQQQFPYQFNKGDYRIEKEKLYKYIKVYNIEGIPENIHERMGEFLVQSINNTYSDRIIKANFTMNIMKFPDNELQAKIKTEKFMWKTINGFPTIWGLLYDKLMVEEKIEALDYMTEVVRKGVEKFITTQLYITVVSYSDIDLENELMNLLSSSTFGLTIVEEKFVSSTILFSGVTPLTLNKNLLLTDKEILLTQRDVEGFMNMSIGQSSFSLTRPVIIGISNGQRVCYIDSYDPRIEAPNGIVVGATGSGKSFTKIYELIKLLFLPVHPLIIIIDRGGSFINFVKIFGGKAVTLNLSSPKNNINPFIYDEEFKKYILLLSNHLQKEIEDKDIIKEYNTADGELIYEDKEGILYEKDDNDNYHVYLPDELSPQTKINFFSRIINSMSKTNKKDFKRIINDSILKIIEENNKTFTKKITNKKRTVLIIDKTNNKVLFNTKEIVEKNQENIIETQSYIIYEENNKIILESKEIIGYKKEFENSKINILKYETETKEEIYYFTVEDVQKELINKDEKKYEEEINILNSFIDLTLYGNLFNGPPVLNFDEELLWTVDMGEDTPEDLAAIILQSLNIIQWNSILNHTNKARKKMIIFDEVHQILANVEDTGPAEAIGYMYRTIRKHGGGIHILSQSSADIFKKSDEVPTELLNTFNGIKSNSMYKYIIGINSTDAARSQEDFQLTDTEISEIVEFSEKKSTVPSARGMIYINTKAFKGFLNVIATPTIYAIATTMKEEKNLQEAIEKMLKRNEEIQKFFKDNNIVSEERKNNVITSIKIIIFKSLFPKGIGNIYGNSSKDIFLKKHIDKQEAKDKYLAGFKDFLRVKKEENRIEDIIRSELRKLEELLNSR